MVDKRMKTSKTNFILSILAFVCPHSFVILVIAFFTSTEIRADQNDFIKQNCIDCHDAESKKGGLDLTSLSNELTRPEMMAKWIRIHDRVAAGEMPPDPEASPSWTKDKNGFLDTLSKDLTKADLQEKGVLIRRLTRVEYENTLHDLLGVRTQIQTMLPEDGKAHGFDKVSEGLDLSSSHLQRYIDSAGLALREAIHKGPRPETKKETLEVSVGVVMPKELEKARVPLPDGSLVFFGDGGFPTYMVPFDSSVAGRYRFKISGKAHQSEEAISFKLAAGRFGRGNSWRDLGIYQLPPEGGSVEVEFWLYAGDKLRIFPQIGNGFQMWRMQNAGKPSIDYPGPGLSVLPVECEGPIIDEWPGRGHKWLFGDLEAKAVGSPMKNQGVGKFKQAETNQPQMGRFNQGGKFQGQGQGQFKGQGQFRQAQNYFYISPSQPREDAKRLIEAFIPVAFRRPVPSETTALYVELTNEQLNNGAPFEDAMITAYTALLAAPEFLYLKESVGKLDDYAIASRLSYFLWSSAPDTELIALAAKGDLSKPDVLRAQTERMLADKKGERFVENFTGQWLSLREIEATTPDNQLYPEFDDELEFAMRGETRGFFEEILRNNLSNANFIDSDWTMLNERLAKHYGMKGGDFRKVSLRPEHHRGGVMTHASVLKVTANGSLTSPIKRGSWVLSHLMATPPPPPPPGVPGVEPDTRGATTLRLQLDKHRDLESCNGCHRVIDPPGFALESFDVIGGWREAYRILATEPSQNNKNRFGKKKGPQWKPGLPVDATGVTAEGKPFNNIDDYKKLLVADPHRFTRALTEQLTVYATGRGMGFSDRPELDRITQSVVRSGNGFRDLVHAVVQSELFRTK
jgi:hypothetical protein